LPPLSKRYATHIIAEVETMLPRTKDDVGIVNISIIVRVTIKNPTICVYFLAEGGSVSI
jgi:hypothetical protein